MNFSLVIAATRARVAVMVAGLAWFFGLDAPASTRIVIGLLVLAALAADGLIDEHRIGRSADRVPPPRDRHHTAA